MLWIRGLLSSISLIVIGVISNNVYMTYGWSPVIGLLMCTVLSMVLMATFIYAYEEDSFFAGAMIPILIVVAIVIGQFYNPPINDTLISAFFGAGLAMLIILEE